MYRGYHDGFWDGEYPVLEINVVFSELWRTKNSVLFLILDTYHPKTHKRNSLSYTVSLNSVVENRILIQMTPKHWKVFSGMSALIFYKVGEKSVGQSIKFPIEICFF